MALALASQVFGTIPASQSWVKSRVFCCEIVGKFGQVAG